MQRREGRDAKSRQYLRRNIIKKSGPASKRARRLVVQFAAVSEKLMLGCADLFHDRVSHTVEHLPNRLAAIVTNALGPGRNFSEDFRRQIAPADLFDAPCKHRAPVHQPAIAQQRGSHAHAKREKRILPIRASESANVPAWLALLASHEPQSIFYLPEGRGDEHLRRALITQLLPKSQFPWPHGWIIAQRNTGKRHLRHSARSNKTKTRTAQQMPQIGILDIGTGAQMKFLREQIAQVNRRAPLENGLLGRRKRSQRRRWGAVRQWAEQRFRVRAKKSFHSRPHGMPCCEDQQGVVIGRLLHVRNTGDSGCDAKDFFKMGNFSFLIVYLFPAQIPKFGLGEGKTSGDHPCFFQKQILKRRQWNATARFLRIGRY